MISVNLLTKQFGNSLTKMPGNLARFTLLLIIANSIAAVVRQAGSVTAAVGFALLAGYTAAIILVGAIVVTSGDP